MIEIKNLTRERGNQTVVDDLSIKLYNGRIYGVLGTAGAGKSTLMNLITGCLAPTSGSVRINGFDMQKNPIKAKKCIGYLPDQLPADQTLTPYELLLFVADAKDVSYERAIRQAQEALDLTDLVKHRDRLIKNLSEDDRRRTGIAQTMMGNPDILILDDPTAELTPKEREELRALIRALGKTKTVIVSGRDPEEMRDMCNHILILSRGKLIADIPTEELQAPVTPEAYALAFGKEQGCEKNFESMTWEELYRRLTEEASQKVPSHPSTKDNNPQKPEREGEYELIEDDREEKQN